MRIPTTLLAVLLCAQLCAAQETLKMSFVCDRTGDDIWKLVDLNCDLDYNDPGEATLFWDSTVSTAVTSA